MVNTTKLFKAMTAIRDQTREIPMVKPVGFKFPYEMAYEGQSTVIQELQGFEQASLASPTGSGKTAIFMSLTRDTPSIIIEPRKFLQKQVQTYYNDYVLFGRSEYPCFHAANAAIAPCNRKIPCDQVHRPEECRSAKETCEKTDCKVFLKGADVFSFPCRDCEYIKAQIEAARVLKDKGTVICNFGNFWQLLKHAKVVVIDEADLFFREISKPTKMNYSDKDAVDDTISEILMREKSGLEAAIKNGTAATTYSLQNLLYNVNFLLGHKELCFKYQRKGRRGGDKIYIEISPDSVNVLKDKIFKGKRLLIVSATLGEFDIPRHSYSVWQRRATFYCPVAKLTSTNFKKNPWIMDQVAEQIETISTIAEGMFDTHKFPVHCGNLGTHAVAINNLLGPDRKHLLCATCNQAIPDISPEAQMIRCPECGKKWNVLEEKCTLHSAGNLMKTIENFAVSDSRYLLIAGADYGGDFSWATLQFIIKYPYASLDERMRVLQRVMGPDKFDNYYKNDAQSRFIQQCGRVCRGAGDVGFTVVFDSKMMEEYQRNKNNYPSWFKETFDGICY